MSYAIGLQNGLIDEKHRKAMGEAVWLYFWLIDHQPRRSDRVHGGKRPVTYQEVSDTYTDLSESTYNRYMKRLVDGGYITTTRGQHGLFVTIYKAKKWHGEQVSEPSNMTEQKQDPEQPMTNANQAEQSNVTVQPEPSKMTYQEPSEVTDLEAENRQKRSPEPSNVTDAYNEEKQEKQYEETTTNVGGPPPEPVKYGNACINKILETWTQTFGHPPDGKAHLNRYAAQTLISRAVKDPKLPEGMDPCDYICNQVRYVRGAMQTIDHFPTIASLMDLRDKRNAIDQAVQRFKLSRQNARKEVRGA